MHHVHSISNDSSTEELIVDRGAYALRWFILLNGILFVLHALLSMPTDIEETQPYAKWAIRVLMILLAIASVFREVRIDGINRRVVKSWQFLQLIPLWQRSYEVSDSVFVNIDTTPSYSEPTLLQGRRVTAHNHRIEICFPNDKKLKLTHWQEPEKHPSLEVIAYANRVAACLKLSPVNRPAYSVN